MGDDHRSKAENPMAHALSRQWPFGKSKLDLKKSSLRRVRLNNLKLAPWRAELVASVAPAEAGSIGSTVSVVWKEGTLVFVFTAGLILFNPSNF